MNRISRLVCTISLIALLPLVGSCAGLSMTDPSQRTPGTAVDDALLGIHVNKAIDSETEDFQNHAIRTFVFDGVVLLLGHVETLEQKYVVTQAVLDTLNVRGVQNELGVGIPKQGSNRVNATVLSGRIRTHLINTPNLAHSHYRVVTRDGIAYLMGRVTREEAGRAADVVAKTRGVRRVVKVLEYID